MKQRRSPLGHLVFRPLLFILTGIRREREHTDFPERFFFFFFFKQSLTLKKKPTPPFASCSSRSLIESEKASPAWSSSSSPSPRRADSEISIRLPPRFPLGIPTVASLSYEHSDGAPELQPPSASLSLFPSRPWEGPASRSMLKTL
ncbi:hypothetical protein EYF80_046008 [Liparis tanakae]|uniref:Uncharacterized protein n=1 Tax=Liparis tanakae TaxID=230148 RepID=A0A4Z2FS22_9TELE|nr:hypothetical protein EYF80_046008 [Liparis tanakae]